MTVETRRRDWGETFATYTHPRVVTLLFLGFSAGLPFMLVFSTLSAWLREIGIDRTTIGMLSWVGLVYSIKFFWAPVVDRLPLPLLGRWEGCAAAVEPQRQRVRHDEDADGPGHGDPGDLSAQR